MAPSTPSPTIVLITGMSGVGKSTTLDELDRRGWRTVETDLDGWSIEGPGGDPIWDEPRMNALLDSVAPGDRLAISGTVRNQGVFRHRFSAVILLSARMEVMLQRVRTRTTNPFGHAEHERHQIVRDTAEVLPLLRRGTTLEIDTTDISSYEVAAEIERHLNGLDER